MRQNPVQKSEPAGFCICGKHPENADFDLSDQLPHENVTNIDHLPIWAFFQRKCSG